MLMQIPVNISFQTNLATDDAISFKLQGMNSEPILVSGNVEFGIVGGRDANVRGLADAINNVSGKNWDQRKSIAKWIQLCT